MLETLVGAFERDPTSHVSNRKLRHPNLFGGRYFPYSPRAERPRDLSRETEKVHSSSTKGNRFGVPTKNQRTVSAPDRVFAPYTHCNAFHLLIESFGSTSIAQYHPSLSESSDSDIPMV
jgi:hypothetical protein